MHVPKIITGRIGVNDSPEVNDHFDQGIEGENSGFSNRSVTCYGCGNLGHMAWACPKPQLTGLWPIFQVASFPSPPIEAWAPGVVDDWFRGIGLAQQTIRVSSFR